MQAMYKRELTLTEPERDELQRIRDHDPRPYLREKAAALLKIAAGLCPHQVAHRGLLKHRQPRTVYRWLNHYQQQRKLVPRPACRRAFSP